MQKKILSIGAGAWGTALSQNFATAGFLVDLWVHDSGLSEIINDTKLNKYLPNTTLHKNITAIETITSYKELDIVIVTIPSPHFYNTLVRLDINNKIPHNVPIIIATKGLYKELEFLSDALRKIMPNNPIAVISGPNFAHEIAEGLPAASVIASDDIDLASNLCNLLSNDRLRLYASDDMVGIQICSAVKNVIAIASGIVVGKSLGENAVAAIITRGLAELNKLLIAYGCNASTIMSLAAIGDVILTCKSIKSRNTSLGIELAKGKSLDEIIKSRNSVAEGVFAASSVLKLASKFNVEMPICYMVHKVLANEISIDEAIKLLMQRSLKIERS